MRNILLIGAGRSATALISYLKKNAQEFGWHLTIGDYSLAAAQKCTEGFTQARALHFDVHNDKQLLEEVDKADLVISMLPAHMHLPVARCCIDRGKHLFTASYVSPQVKALHKEALDKDCLILMEMGLDPGIDHMSAVKEINDIKTQGGEIVSFKSFTGGLVAPESDDNPWHYKFTWNPRNVVLAGKGDVKFIRNGRYKYIPYHNVFNRIEHVFVDDYGRFEAYANRDSLKYRKLYGLENIPTIFRGTLRGEGFCEAWNVFVQLGMTSDDYQVEHLSELTYRDFLNAFLVFDKDKKVEEKLAGYLGVSTRHTIIQKLYWLGLFSNEKIGMETGTPAQVLQRILERKWQLEKFDRDMIVMQHQIAYRLNNEHKTLISSMVIKGDNAAHTSMAKTVGLPLGIAVKLFFEGKLNFRGVHIPVIKELYEPILEELKQFAINFKNKIVSN